MTNTFHFGFMESGLRNKGGLVLTIGLSSSHSAVSFDCGLDVVIAGVVDFLMVLYSSFANT